MLQKRIGFGVAALTLGLLGCGDGPRAGNPVVEVVTNVGKFRCELFADTAPKTTENFLAYVDAKHYDGVIFHRVIKDFMVQTGGFDPGMKERPTKATIRNESPNGEKNLRGTLAMARTSDPHSASSQFFVNVKTNGFLDRDAAKDGWGYAVFGRVLSGMEVVDEIRAVRTHAVGGHDDVPVNDVVVESIRRVSK